MNEKNKLDCRIFFEVLEKEEEALRENALLIENGETLSLADMIREKWETIDFLLANYRKQGLPSHIKLAELLAKTGKVVSVNVLITTIARVRKTRGKRAKVVREVSSAAPLVVTKPMVMTKPLAVSVPVVATTPVEEVEIDWAAESVRLAVEMTNKFVDTPWCEQDQVLMDCFKRVAKDHSVSVSALGAASILTGVIDKVSGLLLKKARTFKTMPA